MAWSPTLTVRCGSTQPPMSGNATLDDSLALLQSLQDTAERSWRAYQEEEERHHRQPGGAAGSSAAGQPGQPLGEPGETLLTPPTKAPGEVDALELQLSAHQRKLAAVWRQDLSGHHNAAPLTRPRTSPPNSETARTALPPASIKSPNRLLSPFSLGAGAPHTLMAPLDTRPIPRPATHPSPSPPHTRARARTHTCTRQARNQSAMRPSLRCLSSRRRRSRAPLGPAPPRRWRQA